MAKTAIVDVETDGLDYTKIHCAVAYVIEEEKYFVFLPRKFRPSEIPKRFKKDNIELLYVRDIEDWGSGVSRWIMHNGIAFDRKVFKKVLGFEIPLSKMFDTLVFSRLVSIERARHSVDSYGKQFNLLKPEHEQWDVFSWSMLDRCLRDVDIQMKIYGYLNFKLQRGGGTYEPLWLEQAAQELMLRQTENGFYLDLPKAQALRDELATEHTRLTSTILKVFPPKAKKLGDATPRRKNDDTWYSVDLRWVQGFCDYLGGYEDPTEVLGGPYSKVEFREFNLNSAPQRVERLQDVGWEPIEFTPVGNPRFTEESVRLSGDKLPKEVQLLGTYLMVQSRLATVESWLKLRDANGYVHGKIITLGARTHRMSHNNPNMGNIPKPKKDKEKIPIKGLKGRYGYECRECWRVDPKHKDNVLLGCDASGIQLRALAHYANNPEYIREVCEGDIHSVHADILGCDRDTSKTFIYAWLLNAGHAKLGAILGGTRKDGKDANKRFIGRMPFLGTVKKTFEDYGETSDYRALDGRRIYIPSAHLALSTGLQSFESIIMKWVMRAYHLKFKNEDITFWQRNMVHDEFQIEIPEEYATYAGEALKELFAKAGQALGSRCPLDGDYKIGKAWSDTH